MTRIHDDEPDTSEPIVRRLLAAECPRWAARPLECLRTSGTDNAIWRVRADGGDDVVVRLPRTPSAASRLHGEAEVLQALAGTASFPAVVRIPTVRHIGAPLEGTYPHAWAVLDWLDGDDAWTARDRVDGARVADALAAVVLALGALTDVPAPPRRPGERGGPLEPLIDWFETSIDAPFWRAADVVDLPTVKRLVAEGREVVDAGAPPTPVLLHGDLIPGNLLLDGDGRLTAVIDWGMAGRGDRAQDLAPAWAVLDGPGRRRFRAAVGVDDAEWIRARTIELIHATQGAGYYRHRRHPLGDVMTRTLERILGE